jgi:anti-anti-sigma regulatory factor
MLRILESEPGGDEIVLRLSGQIAGPWVDELAQVCRRALARHRLTLDLADVSFVEHAGVRLLRALGRRGVTLSGCSPFVTEQLKGARDGG